jgi:hypothetical protein
MPNNLFLCTNTTAVEKLAALFLFETTYRNSGFRKLLFSLQIVVDLWKDFQKAASDVTNSKKDF